MKIKMLFFWSTDNSSIIDTSNIHNLSLKFYHKLLQKRLSTHYRETPIFSVEIIIILCIDTRCSIPFFSETREKQLSLHERLISNRFEPDRYSSRCSGTNSQRAGEIGEFHGTANLLARLFPDADMNACLIIGRH